ncbi:MAG: LysR family transcriptional regulator [Betaproteobacteria bacterium]|nr:LysR family transcriptional regulator [Betaproteobacteria bacterium]
MRLRHLEVFHAVMRAGTVSGAARLLHISQPAVSKVLQHAEAQLGLTLFERVAGKFHPTPEARRLFAEVDKLHAELMSIRRLAVNLKSGPQQRVRLSVTPALGATVVPLAVARWSRSFASGHCELATHHTRELVQALILSELDLGLTLQDPQHPGVHAEVLTRAPMMALLPARGAALRARTAVRLESLPRHLIGLSPQDPLGLRLTAECEALGLSLQPQVSVQTYQLARQLAEAGVGTAIVDPFTAAQADRGRVAVRPVEPLITVPLVLLTPVAAPLSQPARRLVQELRQSASVCLHEAGIAEVAEPGSAAERRARTR